MKRYAAALTLILLALALPRAGRAGVDAAGEYEIKAAMYVNLLRLVDWPEVAGGDASAAIVIGVFGSEDMARSLEVIALAKSISRSRGIAVKRISAGASPAGCQSLFIGGSDRKKTEALLQAVGATAILTVGENERFLDQGGMIDLVLTDDRVQVGVNLDVTRRAGLTISSQLLKIAAVKKGGGK